MMPSRWRVGKRGEARAEGRQGRERLTGGVGEQIEQQARRAHFLARLLDGVEAIADVSVA